jgi:hypothetical protein
MAVVVGIVIAPAVVVIGLCAVVVDAVVVFEVVAAVGREDVTH